MEVYMHYKILSFCLFMVFLIPGGMCVYLQEQKASAPFEKIIYPALLIDTDKGDTDENYILYKPSAVTVDSSGNIYIINSKMNCISKFDYTGKFIKKWGSAGGAPGEFQFTGIGDSLTIGPDGLLYVVDRGLARVQIFSLDGKYLDGFGVKWRYWPDSIAVSKNGDIYLSVPPENRLQRKYTIHLYKKSKNGYEFAKGFSDSPIWLNSDDITQKENFHITFSAMSYIVIDSKNNIYQVFMNLPIIRKFDSSGRMLWQKTIDLRDLSQMKGEGIIYYELEMKPEKADKNNILSYARKRFASQIVVSDTKQRIYVFLNQKFAILEFDLNGDLIGAYYPYDILLATIEDLKTTGPTGKLIGFMNLALDERNSKAFFVGLNTGELWISKL